jgi:FkbM family methyltransferase
MRLKTLLRKAGIEVSRYEPTSSPVARRMHLLERNRIDLVFDVGANNGQYAASLREGGYRGRIVSFEPLTSAFSRLEASAKADPLREIVNIGLGDRDERATINIAGNSQSSSLLEMLPAHLEAAPVSAYVGKEEITVARLDSVFTKYHRQGDHTFLKIDAQGYEKKILEGASLSLKDILGIQLEMSIEPLYSNEMPYLEMLGYVAGLGFTLASIEPGFGDPVTGRMLQMDGIFYRAEG